MLFINIIKELISTLCLTKSFRILWFPTASSFKISKIGKNKKQDSVSILSEGRVTRSVMKSLNRLVGFNGRIGLQRSATRSKILRKQKEGTIYENLVKKWVGKSRNHRVSKKGAAVVVAHASHLRQGIKCVWACTEVGGVSRLMGGW
jgi:hypothetical protein